MNETGDTGETGRSPRTRRHVIFALLAILLGTSPFIVLEVALRVFGIGEPTSLVDPYFGFGPTHPLFDLDRQGTTYRTSRSRSLFFGEQQFPARKGKNTFRIFCLGGSTVRGRPYTTETAFTRWMEIELNARDPSHTYEVINCGGLSYASYRLSRMLNEILTYEPDLVVIATGQNEFLEDRTYGDLKERSDGILAWLGSTRIVTLARSFRSDSDVDKARTDPEGTLPGEVHVLLDEKSGFASYHRDETWRSGVQAHFRHSMRSMVDRCRDNDLPLLLVALGSNLRDCPPFKSELAAGLSTEQQQEWGLLFEKAIALEYDPAKALGIFRQVAEIDDQYALLHFHIASCHDLLGNYEQAEQAYRKAKRLDICPLRILDEMDDFIHQLAADTGTPLAEAGRRLSAESPQGIAGNNVYMDHVHPTIRAHQLIATTVIDELVTARIVETPREWTAVERRAAYRSQMESLPKAHLGNGRRRVSWLENWAKRDRLLREMAPVDARGHLHLGQRKENFAEHDAAWVNFSIALTLDESSLDQVLQFAAELVSEGRPADARRLLDRLAKRAEPGHHEAEIRLAQQVTMRELDQQDQLRDAIQKYGEQVKSVPADNRWQLFLEGGVNE